MNGVLLQKAISSMVIPTVVDDSTSKNHSHPSFQGSLVSVLFDFSQSLVKDGRDVRYFTLLRGSPFSNK